LSELRIAGASLLRQELELFNRLQLCARPGEALAIMGPSGIGKSSLLAALAGTSADVNLEGDFSWSADSRRERPPRPFGILKQPLPIPEWLPVGAFLKAHHRVEPSVLSSTFAEGARTACHRMGLDFAAIRHLFGRELSHGMRSRLGLAALMLLDAPVNLIDEPFSGVDEPLRERLLPIVRDALTGPDKILVFVTHSPLEALFLGTRILLMPADRQSSVEIEIPATARDLRSFLPAAGELRTIYEQLLGLIALQNMEPAL
jgi:NitT/TauT family transport system ATP-binding protein